MYILLISPRLLLVDLTYHTDCKARIKTFAEGINRIMRKSRFRAVDAHLLPSGTIVNRCEIKSSKADLKSERIGKMCKQEGAGSEISAIRENPNFPLRAENERPSHPFAFAAGRSLVGQSTFALAHEPGAEFGYRETDRWKGRNREVG